MEVAVKKSTKKTTSEQFGVLVQEMQRSPELAKGTPVFGATRTKVDEKWNSIATKINSYGPPQRSAMEWRKIWADLKSRTKKKISENHKSMRETGGGPFRFNPLTEMEQTIDQILLISTAAQPRGVTLGCLPNMQPSDQASSLIEANGEAMETPPRRAHPVGVVTPTRAMPENFVEPLSENTSRSRPLKRKRNMLEDQAKLIRLEIKNQELSIEELKRQNTIAQSQADSTRMLAEATKMQAEATKTIAQATTTQTEALQKIGAAMEEMLEILKEIRGYVLA